MTDTDIQSKFAEYEAVIRMLTFRLEEQIAENAKERAEKSDALSVLREVYNNPDAPPSLRVKAAGLALPHEVPRLQSVPPVLELTAEPVRPLSEVVAEQRARADRFWRCRLKSVARSFRA